VKFTTRFKSVKFPKNILDETASAPSFSILKKLAGFIGLNKSVGFQTLPLPQAILCLQLHQN
jgi:hypothetical protein